MTEPAGRQLRLNPIEMQLACTLCLAAPLTVFLCANNYPVYVPEVWLILGLAAILVAPIALLAAARRGKSALFGLWGVAVLSIALMIKGIGPFSLLMIGLGTLGLVLLLADRAPKIFLLAATVHILTSIALGILPAEAVSPTSRGDDGGHLPPVIHIVFDEFAGLHGLPAEFAESGRAIGDTAGLLQSNDFDVFARAYSQYFDTSDSLSNLFNFASSDTRGRYYHRPVERPVLTTNRYFEVLRDKGYALNVYQSSHLDFCGAAAIDVANCTRYVANSIAAIAGIDASVTQKSRFVLLSFLESSRLWRGSRRAYNHVAPMLSPGLPAWPISASHTGPLTSLPVIDELGKRLTNLANGEVHFAHFMVPHYPYALTADCGVRPQLSAWLYRAPRTVIATMGTQNDAASRAKRYAAYLDQYRCTLRIIGELLDAIRISGLFDESIIIIHGDHGSRIVREFPSGAAAATPDEDDYRASYATFFAAKYASSSGRIIADAVSLQRALGEVWGIETDDIAAHTVYLPQLGDATFTAVPLAGFWTTGLAVEP